MHYPKSILPLPIDFESFDTPYFPTISEAAAQHHFVFAWVTLGTDNVFVAAETFIGKTNEINNIKQHKINLFLLSTFVIKHLSIDF